MVPCRVPYITTPAYLAPCKVLSITPPLPIEYLAGSASPCKKDFPAIEDSRVPHEQQPFKWRRITGFSDRKARLAAWERDEAFVLHHVVSLSPPDMTCEPRL